jgi:hypothetical protein
MGGSLRVKSNGALAWIACPERRRYRAIGYRRPNCIRTSDHNYVLKQDAGTQMLSGLAAA